MHLGSEDEADGCAGAEEDEESDDEEGGVGSVADEQRDGHAGGARDDDVVDAQADVLGVVERRDAHVARLPRQETAEHLPTTDSTVQYRAEMTICRCEHESQVVVKTVSTRHGACATNSMSRHRVCATSSMSGTYGPHNHLTFIFISAYRYLCSLATSCATGEEETMQVDTPPIPSSASSIPPLVGISSCWDAMVARSFAVGATWRIPLKQCREFSL